MSAGKSEPPEADAQELRSAASAWPTGLADFFEQHGWQIALSEADCCAVMFLLGAIPRRHPSCRPARSSLLGECRARSRRTRPHLRRTTCKCVFGELLAWLLAACLAAPPVAIPFTGASVLRVTITVVSTQEFNTPGFRYARPRDRGSNFLARKCNTGSSPVSRNPSTLHVS
jgi:hypothetical protein